MQILIFFSKLRKVFKTSITLFRSPRGASSVYSLAGGGVHNTTAGSCLRAVLPQWLYRSLRRHYDSDDDGRPSPARSSTRTTSALPIYRHVPSTQRLGNRHRDDDVDSISISSNSSALQYCHEHQQLSSAATQPGAQTSQKLGYSSFLPFSLSPFSSIHSSPSCLTIFRGPHPLKLARVSGG